MDNKMSIEEQAEKIIKTAEEYGLESNFLFRTTFNRYMVQLKILDELESQIREDGATVTKEYVKGRENLYTHPAIGEYNKTVTSANQTVATLIKIIKSLREDESGGEDKDELLSALGIS